MYFNAIFYPYQMLWMVCLVQVVLVKVPVTVLATEIPKVAQLGCCV